MSLLSSLSLTAQLKSKIRLWIEYALILTVVILMGVTAWNKLHTARLETTVATLSGKLDSANQRVANVEAVNKSQAEAIEKVQQARQLDAAVLTGLSEALGAISTRTDGVRNRLALLEKSNAAVREYLHGNVPDPVGCVLDQSCRTDAPSQNGGARPTGPAAGAVRRPGAGAVQNQR